MDKIAKIMEYYAQKVTGTLGIGFKNFKTGDEYYVNADMRFPSASKFKVPVLIELFNQVEQGKVSLDDMITLKPEDISPGSGVLSVLTPGLTMRVKDYATLMMIVSDNTGTDVTFNLLGKQNIRAMIDRIGLKNTRSDLTCKALIFGLYGLPADMDNAEAEKLFESGDYTEDETLYIDMDCENDISSPRDMITMFSLIQNREIISPRACDQMIEIMTACQTNSRIPYHLPHKGPNEATVYHKTGTLSNVANDSGVVITSTNTYALSLFYNGHRATDEEKNTPHHNDFLLAQISKEIFDALHG